MPCQDFGETRHPSNSEILYSFKKFCVFPRPALLLCQIPDWEHPTRPCWYGIIAACKTSRKQTRFRFVIPGPSCLKASEIIIQLISIRDNCSVPSRRVAGHLRIIMSCRGGLFKHESSWTIHKSATITEKNTEIYPLDSVMAPVVA